MIKMHLVFVLIMFCVIAANAQPFVLHCHPCKPDSLVPKWDTKDHRIIFDIKKLRRLGEAVYMDGVYAGFDAMVTAFFDKQPKLDCYPTHHGEFIVKDKKRKAGGEADTRNCRTVHLWVLDKNNQPVERATIERNGKPMYATDQDAQVGYSGAKKLWRYLLSGSYHKETTVLPGDVWAQRGGLTGDCSYASPKNKFQAGLTGFLTGTENHWTVDNPMYAMLSAPNLPLLFKNNGSYNWQGDNAYFLNPWSYFLKRLRINTTNLLLHAFANYQLLPGFNLELTMGYNGLDTRETSSTPIMAQVPRGNPTGSFLQGDNRFNTLQTQAQLNYKYTWRKFTLNALAAGSFRNQVNTISATALTGYTDDNLLGIPGAAGDSIHTSQKSIYRFLSRFARLSVDYKDRLILSLTGRQDFSSRFSENNRRAQFYSVGAAWNIYKEDSVNKNRYLLNFAKLRGSWGITGNDNIGNYKYLNTYTVTPGYQGIAAVNPNGLANPYYQWETNKKLELALETSWFNKRCLLNLIYYRNRSSNLLLDELLPSQTGFGVIRTNFPAIVQNSGLEVEAETHLSGRHFNWNSKLTLALPRNKLVSFQNLEQSVDRYNLILGQSVNAKRLYRYAGVNDSTGLFNFKDTTDKVTHTYDLTFFGALTESLTLGRVQFTTGFEFRAGTGMNAQAYLYNNLYPGKANETWQTNQFSALANYWTTPGQGAPWQKPGVLNNTVTDKAITSWLNSDAQWVNASYIRWKFAKLSYFLPDSLCRKFRCIKATVFCNAENILTITPYQGADPETLDPLALPPSRILTIGFQITF